MEQIKLDIDFLYDDLPYTFYRTRETDKKVGIFRVHTDIKFEHSVILEKNISSIEEIEYWLLSNHLFKVKTEEDVHKIFEKIIDEKIVVFDDPPEGLWYGINLGKLLEKLKTLEPDESFIIDSRMNIITKTPLEQMSYKFNYKHFVIGVY
nr:MAG TPA: hypothetical protein [Crassvirales sp.]